VRLRAPDLAGARAVLEGAGYAVTPVDGALRVQGVTAPAELTRLLADQGHYLEELSPVAADLESAFLELTEDTP
jgi:ABC-2 type transport system ATP-binding protein